MTWSGSLHSTWRLLPEPTASLQVFLDSDGLDQEAVRSRLPYAAARAGGAGGGTPSPKRYRDARQVYQTAGFIIERGGVVEVTPLGAVVRRFLDSPTMASALLIGPHAVQVLGAAQLRNPGRAASTYALRVKVHPFHAIWRVMAACDWKISSEELNRVVMRIEDDGAVVGAANRIRQAREILDNDVTADSDAILGPAVIAGRSVNDRLIPWISLASFGYSLIGDKDSDGYYRARPEAKALLSRAAANPQTHHEFEDMMSYLDYLVRILLTLRL